MLTAIIGLVGFYCLFQAGPIIRAISWVGYTIVLTIVGMLLWHVGAFEILWVSLSMIFGAIGQLIGVVFGVLF